MTEFNPADYVYEAPSRYWRSLGALTIAVANVGHTPPRRETYTGSVIYAWMHHWRSEDGNDVHLAARGNGPRSKPRFATLTTVGALSDYGLRTVFRYQFEVVPDTQETRHRMIILFGQLTIADPVAPNMEERMQWPDAKADLIPAQASNITAGRLLHTIVSAPQAELG